MHNGQFDDFAHYKRRLQQTLSDEAWNAIHGSTDSEHAFAIWLDVTEPGMPGNGARLGAGLLRMLERVCAVSRERLGFVRLNGNFAVTDGCSLAVCRFGVGGATEASLYYSVGASYDVDGPDGDMQGVGANPAPISIVTSEPLTRRSEDWQVLPPQSLFTVDHDGSHRLTAIPDSLCG